MNKKEIKNKPSLDEQLASFTDQVLADSAPTTKSDDSELQGLQDTVTRLHNAFSDGELTGDTAERMKKDFMAELSNQKTKQAQSGFIAWFRNISGQQEKWRSQGSRQRLGVAVSMAAVIVLLLVILPFIDTTATSQPAASGQALRPLALIIFGSLVLLVLWTFRRKK